MLQINFYGHLIDILFLIEDNDGLSLSRINKDLFASLDNMLLEDVPIYVANKASRIVYYYNAQEGNNIRVLYAVRSDAYPFRLDKRQDKRW